MIIQTELCVGCGKCVLECFKGAIGKDGSNKYKIDQEKCVNCEGVFDIECIRVCKSKAITKDDGSVPEFDATWRLRSEHIPYLIAVMGSRDDYSRYPVDVQEWKLCRKLIAAVYSNPDLKVRLTKIFDDMCIGCPRKQEPGHVESSALEDDVFFEKLGVKPGDIIKFSARFRSTMESNDGDRFDFLSSRGIFLSGYISGNDFLRPAANYFA